MPEARNNNWESKLLEEFFKHAKKHGVKIVTAKVYTHSTKKSNTNFWIKNGFKKYSQAKALWTTVVFPKENVTITCYVKKLSLAK